jgi:hypothetical protein
MEGLEENLHESFIVGPSDIHDCLIRGGLWIPESHQQKESKLCGF